MLGEQEFRDLMAGVCAPVTVVTTIQDDNPYGATVSAFASLSLRPAMVSIALDRQSSVLARITASGRFGVNVLGHAQSELALGFARRAQDRFAGVAWQLDQGLPRLLGAPGWLACDVQQSVEGGDHILLLGAVTHADTRHAAPLVYGHRRFGTHSAYPAARTVSDQIAACAR
ncbi:flavin reductase family protein [Actinoplanes sp. NPDC020271]|uniref:flavin reductase family protein n=1 Tax=Actinoplanes sp. NPDC020271 TaxID=3363896 RepID=UPI00378EBEDA